MLHGLIHLSLRHRAAVLLCAGALMVAAGFAMQRLPVDVFPELNAPTVVVLSEAGGLSADEVEAQVTVPIENAVNGLPGLRKLRSSSALGLSIVRAEFGWGEDLTSARQQVAERLSSAREILPPGVDAEISPLSSITGEIMLLSVTGTSEAVSPLELRSYAEFTLRPRLLSVPGVSQVVAIGGHLPEYQVECRQDRLRLYHLTLAEVVEAARQAHSTLSAGFLPNVRGEEIPVRQMAQITSPADISRTVVAWHDGVAVTIGDVAEVKLAATPSRGSASERGKIAAILSVQKAPGTNTLSLTAAIDHALDQAAGTVPAGMVINRHVFRQADFISLAVDSLLTVLRDAAIIISIVLLMFLLNVRTTLITLTALPLSLGLALIALWGLGLTVNVMTLGGLAVAIGGLVDDAIIYVENAFRRLGENHRLPVSQQRQAFAVIFDASREISGPMVFATVIIVLVFVPLLFLGGIEGRFFRPLGISYIISTLASLLVALTVTPALCRLLLSHRSGQGAPSHSDGAGAERRWADTMGEAHPPTIPPAQTAESSCDKASGVGRNGRRGEAPGDESFLVRWLKQLYTPSLAWALRWRRTVVLAAAALTALSLWLATSFGTSFLPSFREGTYTVFVMAPPGSSLAESERLAGGIERRLATVEGLTTVVRRTGRAERDEHAEPPSNSEIEVTVTRGYDPDAVRTAIDSVLADTPGITAIIGQPIEHRLSALLSGTPAAIAIDVVGDDLERLRAAARSIEAALRTVPGARDVAGNREVLVSTLPIRYRHDDLARVGLTPAAAAVQVQQALDGVEVAMVNQGSRRLALTVRLHPEERERIEQVRELVLVGPSGAQVRLYEVADLGIEQAANRISREGASRKVTVSCNVAEGANLGHLVGAVRQVVDPIAAGAGVTVRYGGQFEAQQEASRTIAVMGAGVVLLIFLLLAAALGSPGAAGLVLLNLPLSLIGGILAIFLSESAKPLANALSLIGLGGTYVAPVVSIASLVGFVTLFGIAVRNGILLVHRWQARIGAGEAVAAAVQGGSLDRLVAILMTALTAAIGLVPLALTAGKPGSEILAPLAVVVLGGLASSTLLNLYVVPAAFAWVFSKHGPTVVNDDAPPAGTAVIAPSITP